MGEEQGDEEEGSGGEGGDASGGGADVVGEEKSAGDGEEAVGDGGEECELESLSQLEGAGDGEGDHGGDDEDADGADGDGYGGGDEEGEKGVQVFYMDAGDFCDFFVVGDVNEFMVIAIDDEEGGKCQDGSDGHVYGGDGEHGAEEVSVGVGVEVAGADEGDSDTDRDGEDDREDEVSVFFEILTEKFDGESCGSGEEEGNEDGTFPKEKADSDASKGRMSEGIANHGVPAEDEEEPDAGAEDGDADRDEKCILHKTIAEHGRTPL